MKKYIKWILVLAFIVFANQAYGYGIVNNSGTSSEDSLNINVLCLDSLGRPTKCDSFYVVVFKSGTNAVAFRDSGTIAMAGLDSTIIGGRTAYYYHRATADIDGDGVTGQYAGRLISVTVTANLPTETLFDFQVVGWELDEMGDSAGIGAKKGDAIEDTVNALLDSLQAGFASRSAIGDSIQRSASTHSAANVQALWNDTLTLLIAFRDSVNNAIADANKSNFMSSADSTAVKAMMINNWVSGGNWQADMVEISGDATAANNFETMLDGTGGQILSLRGLHIRGTTAGDTGLIATGNGVGHGFFVQGGATGHGIFGLGGSTSGDGFRGDAATSGYGMRLTGAGTAKAGLYALGGTIGHGILAHGGSTSGSGIIAEAATSGDGIYAKRLGAGKYDINLAGDGTIHGTVDRVIFVDSTDTTIKPPQSIAYVESTDTVIKPPQSIAYVESTDTIIKPPQSIAYVESTDTVIKPPQSIAYVDSVDTLLSPVSAVSCAGWGAYTVTLYLLDDSDSTGVSGVKINIYDSTGGDWQAGHITQANGTRQFSLDASTYTIHLQDPPNAITSPQYMTISADTTDTFWVTVFDPGSPPSGDKCRVWCLVSDLTGDWLSGCRLSAWIPGRYHPVTLDTTLVSPYTVSATSNDTGYVYMDIYESGELTAGNGETVKMYIVLRAPNGDFIARTFVEIPDADDYEIIW